MRLATLKSLKRGDNNELKRNLRLEKVVTGKQLRLVVETEEERRTRLENDAAILKTLTPTTERNIDNELLHASLILLYMYL